MNEGKEKHCNIAIVGGGAAGLFAGACLASLGPSQKVILLEKNKRTGRKLLMAGAGQCNLTHSGSIKDFLTHYGPAGKSIRTILYRFNNDQVISFFQERGIPLFTREDGKVFPQSLLGSDILNTLVQSIMNSGFELRCEAGVTAIQPQKDGYLLQCGDGTSIHAQKVIIASGGCSYPTTGSDGSFFSLLGELGLEIAELRPALVPLYTADYPYGELSGISFSPAEIGIWDKATGKKLATTSEDLLLTHRCFSGPGILNLSRYGAPGRLLRLNYLPGCRREELERHLKTSIRGDSRQIRSFLAAELPSLPRRFLEALCLRIGVDPGQKAAGLTGGQTASMATLLTEDTHTITSLGGFNTAMVTSGGVALSELNLKTMETKKYPGLYVVGEALNVDGDTGGYNLQFAFSSAHLAVSSIMCP